MTGRFSVILAAFASLMAAAETPWEPGKVVAVEEVSIPAKAADPSCLAVPKGAAPPARCRASNLRARQFWRVTIDVGSRRFVVRPYRAQNLLDTLNQDGTVYVNPNLTAASLVEVAVTSTKAVRLKTEGGQEMPALVDSQALVSRTEAPPPVAAGPGTLSDSKVVLLENDDFHDLEIQECKSQNIGDGAALYSFPGGASPVRAASKTPAFVVLAGNGNVELSRLQVGKGARELAVARNRSASPVPIVVTPVSATLRKFTVKDPLPPGEYVVLLENSNRGFLFGVP
ncbi:MAG TPA: hypothetical protein VLN48_22090 [Bryobacteraceae bacterium]|nr:hypothetical protein [Bryobacteraceae bacterium]